MDAGHGHDDPRRRVAADGRRRFAQPQLAADLGVVAADAAKQPDDERDDQDDDPRPAGEFAGPDDQQGHAGRQRPQAVERGFGLPARPAFAPPMQHHPRLR